MPKLNFFITTDVHLGKNSTEKADYDLSLTNMEALHPDIPLIIPGDLTNFGEVSWFKAANELFEKHNLKPVLLTLGNHDVRGFKGGQAPEADVNGWLNNWKVFWEEGKDSLEDPRFEAFSNMLPVYQKMLKANSQETEDTLYTHHILNGYHFFFLSTERPLKDQCYLSKKQLEWLKDGLTKARKENAEKPIFIFSHQALNGTHLRSEEYGGFGPQNDEVLAILNEFSNLIFCSGHIHNGLGVAQELRLPFGYAFDLTSYCLPDNGLLLRSLGYYVTVTSEKVSFLPYFFGNQENKNSYPLPMYQKELYF